MHQRYCFIVAGLVFLALQENSATAQPKNAAPSAPPPARVFVTAVRADMLDEPKAFVGTVMPLRKSVVGSAAPGRVEEYLVNEGDFVKKGSPIAHLRRGIIGAEKKAAEAELLVRRAALAEMENSHQDEVAQAQALLAVAEANHKFRQAKLDRARQLGAAITREAFEEEVSLAAQASANVTHAQATLRVMSGSSWEQKLAQMQSKVAVQEAEVERLSEMFDRHTMFAPFDGWVTKEFTEVGQWLMQGDDAAEIAELGQVDIEIAVLEDYVTKLAPGVMGRVEVNALRGQQFPGKVAIINPQADARARTFPVKVRVDNIVDEHGPLLKAGMFARVTLPVGDAMKLPLVPKDAISIGGRSPVVYVVDTTGGKNTVRPLPVTLGVANGQWVSVGANELKEGDVVVVEGNERLRPGQEVRPDKIEVSYP
jgi:HlyD family secretion protein